MGGGWAGGFMALCTVGRANRLCKPLRQNSIDVLGFRVLLSDEKVQARWLVDAAWELLPELLFGTIFDLMRLFYSAALTLSIDWENQAAHINITLAFQEFLDTTACYVANVLTVED